jgi:hypothetical protein
MKDFRHNSNYSGTQVDIKVVTNGFIVGSSPNFSRKEEVFKTFEEMVNELAYKLGVKGIWDSVEVKLIEKK